MRKKLQLFHIDGIVGCISEKKKVYDFPTFGVNVLRQVHVVLPLFNDL